jgi:hypothetical protein
MHVFPPKINVVLEDRDRKPVQTSWNIEFLLTFHP